MSIFQKLLYKKKDAKPLAVQYSTPRKMSDPFLFQTAPKIFKEATYSEPEPEEDDMLSPREVKTKPGEYNLTVEMDTLEDKNYYVLSIVAPGFLKFILHFQRCSN
jgi:hypothetical protein